MQTKPFVYALIFCTAAFFLPRQSLCLTHTQELPPLQIHWGASTAKIKLTAGPPAGETAEENQVILTYNLEFYNAPAVLSYIFYNGRLSGINFYAPELDVNANEARALFKTVEKTLKQQFKPKKQKYAQVPDKNFFAATGVWAKNNTFICLKIDTERRFAANAFSLLLLDGELPQNIALLNMASLQWGMPPSNHGAYMFFARFIIFPALIVAGFFAWPWIRKKWLEFKT